MSCIHAPLLHKLADSRSNCSCGNATSSASSRGHLGKGKSSTHGLGSSEGDHGWHQDGSVTPSRGLASRPAHGREPKTRAAAWSARSIVFAPILERGGPSNQIFQLKEVLYNVKSCKHKVGVLVPPILPHYTQRKADGYVPFSHFFDLDQGWMFEEQDLLTGGHLPLLWPNEECIVLYSPSAPVLTKNARSLKAFQIPRDPTLARCTKFLKYFQQRTNGTVCKSFSYRKTARSLCSLADQLQGRARFALTCDLERPVPRDVVFTPALMPKEADYDLWVNTARSVKLRRTKKLRHATLAVQLRVPDYVLVNTRKRDKIPDDYTCVCLHKACLHCEPAHHIYVPRARLATFILKQLKSNTLMRSLAAVHLMSNDPGLAGYLESKLQARGYAVTVSTDASFGALMADYDVAAQSTVFWATKASSIATNVIHARLAEGKPMNSVFFWEDIWDKHYPHKSHSQPANLLSE